MLSLDPDRLLHNFRVNAGLEPKAPVYGGWESQEPWVNIRCHGHTLGHWLTAGALMYASTGDERFRDRVNYIVRELRSCQEAGGNGLICAFPDGVTQLENALSGQRFIGVPWYTMADGAAVDEETGVDFSYVILNGAEESDKYRFNLGVVNGSDPQTSITISIQPFQPNGEPYLDENENEVIYIQLVPPAAHLQFFRIFPSLWGITEAEPSMIKVSIEAWASTSPEPVVLMTTYGSLVDTRSNDPSTVLGSFAFPFDIECMFPSPDPEGLIPARHREAGQPVQMPPR
jgi:hypothetical protein